MTKHKKKDANKNKAQLIDELYRTAAKERTLRRRLSAAQKERFNMHNQLLELMTNPKIYPPSPYHVPYKNIFKCRIVECFNRISLYRGLCSQHVGKSGHLSALLDTDSDECEDGGSSTEEPRGPSGTDISTATLV
jgi:hypothetical protein